MSIAGALFKGQSKIELEKSGEKIFGRGIVSKYSSKDFPEYEDGLIGNYTEPLYVYLGDCEKVLDSIGERLLYDGGVYRIIKTEYVSVGSIRVYVRALLEKESDDL